MVRLLMSINPPDGMSIFRRWSLQEFFLLYEHRRYHDDVDVMLRKVTAAFGAINAKAYEEYTQQQSERDKKKSKPRFEKGVVQ